MSEVIDNRARRIEILKMIIRSLHDGANPNDVRAELKEIVHQCDAGEIAAMEHQLIHDEGIPVQQIMGMCDLHAEVVKDILVERDPGELRGDHPVVVFRQENEAIQNTIERFQDCMETLYTSESSIAIAAATAGIREAYQLLADVDKHYARKENLLFPFLEQHGIQGPSKVMWGVDDQIRSDLADLGEAIHKDDLSSAEWKTIASGKAQHTISGLMSMITKEERILFPMSLDTLTASQWNDIREQSTEFGWCIIDEPEVATPLDDDQAQDATRELPDRVKVELKIAGLSVEGIQEATDERLKARSKAQATEDAAAIAAGRILFDTGTLSPEQLRTIFELLPVDLTFVDENDRVKFFSESAHPVFPRVKAIIGRKVQNCHPPSSVHIVQKILDDFRAGREDVAEFWLEFKERFVFVRYIATRDANKEYTGCLEVTQDITRERALTGERRILQYGTL